MIAFVVAVVAWAPPAPVSWTRQIAPLLRARCTACHGDASPAGGLSLTTYASLMRGGKDGPAVTANKAAASRLIAYLTGRQQPRMPPDGPLPAAQIDRIRAWIDAGARTDGPAAEPRSPTAISAPLVSAPIPVTALAWRPDGHVLAAGGYGSVYMVGSPAPAITARWPSFEGRVRSLAWSQDGTMLAAGGGTPGVSGAVWLFNPAGAVVRRLSGPPDIVNAVAFSPDGHRVAAACADKSVRVWNVGDGSVAADLRDHSDAVNGVAWTRDGRFLATASSDRTLKVWDGATLKRLYSVAAHEDAVTGLAAGPGSDEVVTVSDDGTARTWKLAGDGASQAVDAIGAGGRLAAVACAGSEVIATGADGAVWMRLPPAAPASTHIGAEWIYAAAVSPDGRTAAVGGWDGAISLVTTADRKVTGSLRLVSSAGNVPVRRAPESVRARRGGSAAAPAGP